MDKLQTLKLLTGATDSEDGLLLALLARAERKILERLYPYHPEKRTALPDQYSDNQIEIAEYLYNKRGAEGQIVHSENGISRTWASADIPDELMKGITPFVGGVR